jgi:L-ascorbate metabolism protein UlaG (beta-lactamase superfamily)
MITVTNTALADWHNVPLTPSQIACWWLGQAGFLFRHEDICFVIDPYLSDSLAIKYRDKPFAHTRLMPVPIEPAKLTGMQWIFCTHEHTDHMDGGTLPDLVTANPDC